MAHHMMAGPAAASQAALKQRGLAVDSVKLLSSGVTAPVQGPAQAAGNAGANVAVIAGGAAAALAVLAAAVGAFVALRMRSRRRRVGNAHAAEAAPKEPEFRAEPFYSG